MDVAIHAIARAGNLIIPKIVIVRIAVIIGKDIGNYVPCDKA